MANTEAGRGLTGGRYTAVLMGLSIVLVLGFLVWLGVTSEPSQVVAITENGDEQVDDPAGAAQRVAPEEFAAATDGYRGHNVELAGVSVAAPMGTRAFWIQLPDGSLFLVLMPPALVAEGRRIQPGEVVTVSGFVHERTDSVLVAWEAEGVIATGGQRAEAEFASSFLEARRVTTAPVQ